MDQAAKDRIRNEIEDEVRTLFPGAVRRVDWQSHSDDPALRAGRAAALAGPYRTARPTQRAARARRGIQEVPECPRPGRQAVPARAGTAVA